MSSSRREEFVPYHVTGKDGQLFTRRKTKYNANSRASMSFYMKSDADNRMRANTGPKSPARDERLFNEELSNLKALRKSRFFNEHGWSSQ